MSISAFELSSSPSNSFAMLLIHSFGFFFFFFFFVFLFFCYVLFVAIFYSRIVQFLFHLVVGMCSCHLPQLVGRIFFRCFGKFCFACIVLLFVDIFLIFLLSPELSGLFPQVLTLLFFFNHVSAFFFYSIVFVCFRRFFLSAFPVEFPIQILIFFVCVFK